MTRPARLLGAVTAGALAVVLAACGGPSGGVQVPDATTAAATSEAPAPEAPVAPRAAGNVLPEVPTAVRLPDGRRVPVAPAPTDDTGRLAVPDDPDVAGWWDGGARPGDPFGATVVAAHVDSVERGLGPFASLLSARRGERVTVTSAGLTTTYRVSSLRTIPKERLRTDGSVFAGDGDPRLVLVTCAGPYERARGGYQNLLVLTAVPVGPTTERGTMNDDPFEKLRLDLHAALSDLTDSTRARLDGIAVVPPPRVDAVSALRRRGVDVSAPQPEPEQVAAPEQVDESAPPRPGSPPVRVRRSVRTGSVRVVVPDAPPVVPVEEAPTVPVRVAQAAARARVPREERVPVPAGRGGAGLSRPPVPPRARPLGPPPSQRPLRTPPPEQPGGRRRVLVAVGIVAVLVLVVAGGFLASRPAPVADAPTAAPQSDTLPPAPTTAPDPGRLVRVEPQPDGSVQVTQWLAFDAPVRTVEVAAPTSRRDDRRLSTASVEGQGVATVQLTGVAAPQVVTFRSPTDRVRMRYTVRDAVEVSDRDEQRALVDLPTVSISSEGSDAGPTVVRIAGATVRGVACGRTLRTVRPCGSEDGRGWSLGKPSVDSTSVLATVDMGR